MTSPKDEMGDQPSDGNMARIMAAIELSYAGQRDLAPTEFERIWASLARDPDSFHVCVLSHFMADLQDDVRLELEWDLRALDAASQLTDARVQELHPSLTVAGFLPSLHLNVADACFRAGRLKPPDSIWTFAWHWKRAFRIRHSTQLSAKVSRVWLYALPSFRS